MTFRTDRRALVQGLQKYPDDLEVAEVLHCRFVRRDAASDRSTVPRTEGGPAT
jgi:hypothetical protein